VCNVRSAARNMQGGQQGHAAYHVHAQLRTAWRALARHRSAPLWPTDRPAACATQAEQIHVVRERRGACNHRAQDCCVQHSTRSIGC
jgi:hypothetical protein